MNWRVFLIQIVCNPVAVAARIPTLTVSAWHLAAELCSELHGPGKSIARRRQRRVTQLDEAGLGRFALVAALDECVQWRVRSRTWAELGHLAGDGLGASYRGEQWLAFR
jgi:hypothetical protein